MLQRCGYSSSVDSAGTLSSDDLEVAVFAPVRAPAILYQPIWLPHVKHHLKLVPPGKRNTL